MLGVVSFMSDETGKTNFCLAGYAVWEEMQNVPGITWPAAW